MTTLAASVDASQRTIALTGDVSAGVPGRLYLMDDEVIVLERFHETPDLVGELHPGIDRAKWFVQRGALGSYPTSHAAGAAVYGATPGLSRGSGLALPSPVAVATAPATGETLPIGIIVMWGGTIASIPASWHLCDGQAGTPDLRGLFVKGALVGANPGVTGGAATHGHVVTQPADHAALSHAGATVGDHAALAHSAHAGAAVANHAVTQPSGHAGHVFTQPGAHVFTQPAGHAAHAFTQPAGHGNHVFTQPAAHSNHVVTQPANHVVTQPANHSAHAALGTHAHELPFTKLAGATGALRMLAGSIFGTGTSRAPESVSAAPTANTTAAAVALSQAVSAGTPDAHSAHSGAAVDAHSASAVDAHSAHSAGAVDAHSAHSGGAVDGHSAHSGGAVDAHSGAGVDAHSAHAGTAVDAHGVTQPSAHSDHAALAHAVGQASQHAAQSHSGGAVATSSNEPAFYSLAYIQKIA